jgi:hypothetical protein
MRRTTCSQNDVKRDGGRTLRVVIQVTSAGARQVQPAQVLGVGREQF